MKIIGFIGVYDKTDMLLNIAKILTSLQKKVVIIDSTTTQKAKYIVPVINPTTKYVTEFEDIDVAVGFENLEEISDYLGVELKDLPYDITLIDVDTEDNLDNFDIYDAEKKYFVTAFDLYSLKRGLNILSNINEPINLTKILFSKEMLKEEDDYLNFLSIRHKIVWDEYKIYFPLENGDLTAIMENQRVSKIKFRKLSIQYKDSITYIAEDILGDVNDAQIRRIVKNIERGV